MPRRQEHHHAVLVPRLRAARAALARPQERCDGARTQHRVTTTAQRRRLLTPPSAGHLLDFLAYLELERGLARNTLASYRSDLLQFGAFLAERGLRPKAPTPADVSDFLTALASGDAGVPLRTASIQRKAAACAPSTATCGARACSTATRRPALSPPRRGQKLPSVLGRAEVQRLLDQPRGTQPIELRDRAILELMYACGLRVSETVELEVGGVDLEQRALIARGKGSKERAGPDRPEAVRACARLPLTWPAAPGRRPDRAAAVRQLPRRPADAAGPLQDHRAAMPRRRGSRAR